ncbi:hypothetical protein CDV55_105297 [Aspergillus turcosus]|uniref:Uncharacterized protein n=1 Tax=Aspergillus turcosus TaxID=1245748 RepID=A0A397I5B0_9EURO|nr:hypothetical protein CDV55_105297 [Aspergillus turcosus]RLM00151.1 hypothetical protein CFD26_105638 [Aspergillus turcosus]
MSLVNLAHVCSHLNNATKARLGLTSIPHTNLHLKLCLALQNSGYLSSVVRGGPKPPPPHILLGHPAPNDEVEGIEPLTQANIASRRLWLGLKYWQSEPVLGKLSVISKPTRRITIDVAGLRRVIRGEKSDYVEGLRSPGESFAKRCFPPPREYAPIDTQIGISGCPQQPSPDFDYRMAYAGPPGIPHSQGGMPFSPVASLPRPGTLYHDWDHPARLPAESLRHDYESAKTMETPECLFERNSRRNAEKVKATTRYHSQRRPSNRDEFDGPHQLLKPPSLRVIEEQARELPHLPTNLDVSEQDRILNAVNDRLSQCAFDFVAKYQFPIPLEADKREVRIPSDREWTEWVYLLKRLATKRRIPARVLYNGQIKQLVTVLENSLEMRHAAKHQSRPIKDDRNVLQLISAGTQVAKMLKDASAMEYLDKLYVDTEKRIQDRRSRRVKFASP